MHLLRWIRWLVGVRVTHRSAIERRQRARLAEAQRIMNRQTVQIGRLHYALCRIPGKTRRKLTRTARRRIRDAVEATP